MRKSEKNTFLANDEDIGQVSGGLSIESNKQALVDNNTVIGNNNVQFNMSNNSISNNGDVALPKKTLDATQFWECFLNNQS